MRSLVHFGYSTRRVLTTFKLPPQLDAAAEVLLNFRGVGVGILPPNAGAGDFAGELVQVERDLETLLAVI